jgi:hypothetical protein
MRPVRPAPVRPDVVLHLIAAHTQINRAERDYLRDLLAEYGPERVLVVLNMFTAQGASGTRMATDQSVQDTLCRVRELYGGREAVVTLDCLNGDGLDRLLVSVRNVLGDRGRVLGDVVNDQRARIAERYGAAVRAAVDGYVNQLSAVVPADDDQVTRTMIGIRDALTSFVEDISGRKGLWSRERVQEFDAAVGRLRAYVRTKVTEPIVETRSRDVYRTQETGYWKTENDYGRPIQRTRRVQRDVPGNFRDIDEFFEAIGGFFSRGQFAAQEWVTITETIGYEQKQTWVHTGTTQVFDHTVTSRCPCERPGRRLAGRPRPSPPSSPGHGHRGMTAKRVGRQG